MGGATAAAAAGAAARKRRMQEEEERLTAYRSDDMDGWEFKIVRANTRVFKDAAKVKQIREEEAKAGWEMVEKFDDYRIRFKRRVEERSQDPYRPVDPYRTQIGITEGKIVVVIVSVSLSVGLLIALLAFYFSR